MKCKTLFILRMTFEDQNLDIHYTTMDECLNDTCLDALFENGGQASIRFPSGGRVTRDVSTLEDLKYQLENNIYLLCGGDR